MKQRLFLMFAFIIVLAGLQIAPVLGQDEAAIPTVLTLPEQIAGGRDVTISVSNMPPADQADLRAQWEAQAARFMALYPNVKIEGLELQYDPAAYVALAAGNQLPNLFLTYFTEPSKFIDQGVVADLTPYFSTAGVADVFNPSILSITSQDEKVYGIPLNAYALGLAYNIQLLADAGYDAPPTTWDELTVMAKTLTNRDADVAGFAFINDGSGATGWHFTDIAYAFGAGQQDIIRQNEDGTFTAAYGEGATVEALTFVQKLRWEDDV
ncbi:MAG TPA: extracellular solute-binding protein, partial [Phototrophicaceae bacterium]|nr:extracellular solute-binding protein [Phototrophicaceae bacterium]